METMEPDLKARMSDEDSLYGGVQKWIGVLQILWKLHKTHGVFDHET